MIFSMEEMWIFGLYKGFYRSRYRSGNVNIGHTLTLQFTEPYICKNRIVLCIVLYFVKQVIDSIFTIWYDNSIKR